MRLLTSAATGTVGIAFFGWFVNSVYPAPKQQRPKGHRAGDDQQPECPRPVGGVRINPPGPDEGEWDSKHQAARQVGPEQDQESGGDHGGVVVPRSLTAGEMIGMMACCSAFSSPLSE